ncbi:hypothetical protein Hypma_011861 [Hypsizygus marmoreus]|uniref:Peroxidase n=1 Tax=Hypsizygus marmoreus TaxID=39966 RepID=A0A369JIG5_HYPMA|nr:hypothetical protein Hypma_011861 [Hypsizygus marmoreus]
MLHLRFALALTLTASSLAAEYRWPNTQYEQLEALLYEGRRGDGSSLASIVHPCRSRPDTNASVPAEWLRFAFHDMSTHNVEDGSGGLDGSIAYELGRAENFGVGFTHTLSDFEVYPNKYVSRADIIALGAVLAVATCDGPVIPFRGGRVDTWTAGPTGVPVPQQDIQTHINLFKNAGFSVPEMIKLVACGHGVGGVRSTDFPDLVPPSSSSVPNFINFDTTPKFDNLVVTQYLDGTTKNPLVVDQNKTMVSDLRVFSADSNDTMRSISTPDSFATECKNILERMINVVPHGVVLTDEITLIPAKVHDAQLTFEREKFVFKAGLRLTQPLNASASKTRVVKILWCDRYGNSKDCAGKSTRSSVSAHVVNEDPNLSPVTNRMGYLFINYNFVVPIDATASISKFWFTVDEGDGTPTTTYNNGGDDYVVQQDQLLFVPTLSKTTYTPGQNGTVGDKATPSTGWIKEFFIVAAVRDGSNPSRVYMNALDVAIPGFPAPLNSTLDLQLSSSIPPTQGYSFYTASITDAGYQLTLDIHSIAADGNVYTEDFRETTFLDNTPYLAPTNVTSSAQTSSSSSSWRLIDDVHAARFSIALGVLITAVVGTSL